MEQVCIVHMCGTSLYTDLNYMNMKLKRSAMDKQKRVLLVKSLFTRNPSTYEGRAQLTTHMTDARCTCLFQWLYRANQLYYRGKTTEQGFISQGTSDND